MKNYRYLPDFWGSLLIIGFLWALEMVFAAAFYDAGVAFTYGDPKASVIAVLANGVIFSVLMHLSGLTYSELFHPSPNSVASTLGVLFIPIIVVLMGGFWWLTELAAFIASLFPEDQTSIRMLENLMGSGVATVITICVVAPFLEEMLFRGILLRGFLAYYSADVSIILSALIFGLVHLNIYQIPGAFIMGLFLGWLFYKSKSLWPSIFTHAFYNFGVFLVYESDQEPDPSGTLAIMLSVGVSAFGIWLIHKIFRSTRSREGRENSA